MLEQNKCDIRDQHGLEHIFHRLIVRIDDFCIFTLRTMHPTGEGLIPGSREGLTPEVATRPAKRQSAE